jgi:tRNA(fMet)-specific endonuclease VapC
LHADADAELCISVFTEAEVRVGIANHALSQSQRSAIEGLFANLEILLGGSAEAQIYGDARAKLEAKEIGFSQIYLLIGVRAASSGAVLITHDRHFDAIAEAGYRRQS